ncbi:F-box/WD repeat-containing protein 7 [Neochlamydia sp. EPS4]|uniref:F-box/WD repeat-containing protein n=1 Tax=Neochlamydia sp. EPS4 TaxID=1478175 RepID=UPI0005827BB2|nr:F-box/WD40 repeat-containing protein [Neochlamydia sp. EPS4]KIC74082.1 F-box/WD repeat-containing protein 7 [Neochlamydia sp. EPS4]
MYPTFLPSSPSFSSFLSLPEELHLHLFSYFNAKELCQLQQVCKYFQRMSEDPYLWSKRLKKDYSYHFSSQHMQANPFYKHQSRLPMGVPGSPSISSYSDNWKTKYRNVVKIKQNMENKEYNFSTFQSQGSYVKCIKIANGSLYSGTLRDGTIGVWNIENGEQQNSMKGHKISVNCLKVEYGRIFSGSSDETIRLWNIQTKKSQGAFHGHEGIITCLKIDNGMLYSGSSDDTIRLWDIETQQQLSVLKGHASRIECLKLINGLLFSGAQDKTIRCWDIKREKEICCLQHDNWVTSMKVVHGKLFSGSGCEDTRVKVWDIKKGLVTHLPTENDDGITDVKKLDNNIITSSRRGPIKIWDANTEQCLLTLNGHAGGVNNLQIAYGKIISASKDRTLRIWDPLKTQSMLTLRENAEEVTCLKVVQGRIFTGDVTGAICEWDFRDSVLQDKNPSLLL